MAGDAASRGRPSPFPLQQLPRGAVALRIVSVMLSACRVERVDVVVVVVVVIVVIRSC